MIRFCDQEVCCVYEDELDRRVLLNYFLSGHINEKICVLTRGDVFVGSITYASLLSKEVEEAIQKDYIILNKNIWKYGRKYFSGCKRDTQRITLLPVLNVDKKLICFAWQDDEADRELRMLEELEECENALNFSDVFPEYDGVTINGFHELAYYFAEYLRKTGVPVNVKGSMWNQFIINKDETVLDYKNLEIYAEGVSNLEKEIEFRESVSVEFECIDKIYEENICRGIITDAVGGFSDLLEKLRGREIVILGIGENAMNAYDLLLENGIDISGFVSEEKEEDGKWLLGKRILGWKDALESESQVVIDPDAKYSAWGFGYTDCYSYLGYKRNEKFILLQDYTTIPKRGMKHLLFHTLKQSQRKIILVGDIWLCLYLKRRLEIQSNSVLEKILYCDIFEEFKKVNYPELIKIDKSLIHESDICLLVLPEYYGVFTDNKKRYTLKKELKKRYYEKLKGHDVSEYFIENNLFMKSDADSYNMEYRVKQVIFGSMNGFSGHILFRGILDNHPEILQLEYSYLNDNLYSICIRLAMEKGANILHLFWEILKKEAPVQEIWDDEMQAQFNESMWSMLECREKFQSWEIFVMIHVAFGRMWGKEINEISDMIIYWEPHMNIDRREKITAWLNEASYHKTIVNIIRNAYIKSGSFLKGFTAVNRLSNDGIVVFREIFAYPNNVLEELEVYDGWKRKVIRFEDLKCNPQQELLALCRELKIRWSDTLLETTIHGKSDGFEKNGFSLEPVYNTYEEFFSEFDRFRISLITGPWQKSYGYPYVGSLQFSRREIQQMFDKEFRFDKDRVFLSKEEKAGFKRWLNKWTSICLWTTRRKEIMEKKQLAGY